MKPRLFDKKPENPVTVLAKTDSRIQPHEAKSRAPKTKFKERSAEALENSKMAAIHIAPTVTVGGIAMMCESGGNSIARDISHIFGFFMAVAGLIIDPIKLPIATVVSLEEAIRGGVNGIASAIKEGNPDQQIIRKVYDSFIKKINATEKLMISLELETKDSITARNKSGNLEELIGLTLLYTAYHSRYHTGILLSDDKILKRENCPEAYHSLFDKVIRLKQLIQTGLHITEDSRPSPEKAVSDAEKVVGWIKYIREGKPLAGDDFAHRIINNVIQEMQELRQLAMVSLPEKTERDVRRLKM